MTTRARETAEILAVKLKIRADGMGTDGNGTTPADLAELARATMFATISAELGDFMDLVRTAAQLEGVARQE